MNPRPKIFHFSFYVRSLYLRFTPWPPKGRKTRRLDRIGFAASPPDRKDWLSCQNDAPIRPDRQGRGNVSRLYAAKA